MNLIGWFVILNQYIGCVELMLVYIAVRCYLNIIIMYRLFGPRRRMINIIAEINNGVQASLIDRTELVYCDSLLVKLRDMEDKLKNVCIIAFL